MVAVFLESFVTELLRPLIDISFSCKRKEPRVSIIAYIQNDTKFDSVKFNSRKTDVKYFLLVSTLPFLYHIIFEFCFHETK